LFGAWHTTRHNQTTHRTMWPTLTTKCKHLYIPLNNQNCKQYNHKWTSLSAVSVARELSTYWGQFVIIVFDFSVLFASAEEWRDRLIAAVFGSNSRRPDITLLARSILYRVSRGEIPTRHFLPPTRPSFHALWSVRFVRAMSEQWYSPNENGKRFFFIFFLES